MRRNRTLGALFVGGLAVLTTPLAHAASLQQVTADWKGGATFPSDISMYVYVPDKVAQNPPILVLSHFCGGSACDVFGQAQGNGTSNGGVVQAADKYGFIMVVPSNAPPAKCSYPNGRCWDVVSTATRKRDSNSDSGAIKQMVKYAIDKYKANAERVYAAGDSSGAMMTELLLAVYPDIFKAGSSFAGITAGCGNSTASPGGYDGSCAGGSVTHTAQQWGDIARAMDPNYTGHRPRLQVVHGDKDGTISYNNLGESVKQYTNLLSLATDPTTKVTTGLTLGTHQATRNSWNNSCGYMVLDALTSVGGDHGPSDALFQGQYVVPFLALDKTGDVDPEIQQCGGGGTDGGAAGDAAGTGGAGGAKDAGSGGSGGGTGAGGSATGGSNAGGSTGTGTGAGGKAAGGSNAGGSTGSGGASGGVTASGGSQSSGGNAKGGDQGSGGALSTGGVSSTGGKSSSGGSSGTSSNGGAAGSGGGSNGCSCSLGHSNAGRKDLGLLLGLALGLTILGRRRHGRSGR